MLDFALGIFVLTTLASGWSAITNASIDELRPIPYALVCSGSMVIAARRLGVGLTDYFRRRLGSPL